MGTGFSKAKVAGLVLMPLALGLSGCMGGGAATSDSAPRTGMFSGLFGQATTPAPAPVAVAVVDAGADLDCPKVEIREGGTNYRQGVEKAVKVQFAIRNVARECASSGDTLVMKIGIEGVALIGTVGKPGPATAPLTILVTRGDKVVVTRAVTVKAVIPADEQQTIFRAIEDQIKVPPGVGDLVVTVGFKG